MDLTNADTPVTQPGRTRKIVVLISGSGKLINSQSTKASNLRKLQYQVQICRRSWMHVPPVEYPLPKSRLYYPTVRQHTVFKELLNPPLLFQRVSTREDYDAAVAERILKEVPDVDLVVLAGWMHILSEKFLDLMKMPVINLHPALPGAFDGAHAIERAYTAFQKGEVGHTGVMVHRVVKEVDRGEPILTRVVEIKKEDSLAELETRIHEVEHDLIVEATIKVLQEEGA
ncbi:formyl transferase domain-containing protein [Rhizoctonia solani AG-1 IA]|uniref:phosphoribosylglycinamide formyltransferase 1 n=1 Tax=Thanatephorus cucumeris (strain AG1-IA) TaxID=983506 RepID=L8X1I0_THACA|nr:formyl transferase domain-containing protein [Rhizoctonia solani AG-1 IA]